MDNVVRWGVFETSCLFKNVFSRIIGFFQRIFFLFSQFMIYTDASLLYTHAHTIYTYIKYNVRNQRKRIAYKFLLPRLQDINDPYFSGLQSYYVGIKKDSLGVFFISRDAKLNKKENSQF